MYWINIKALKEDLRSGDYQDRDIVPYIIASGIMTQLFSIGGSNAGIFDLIAALIGIIAIVSGTWYVFGQHKQNSQASFLSKYISLGWVVGFRLFLIIIPVVIIAVILTATRANDESLLYGIGILVLIFYSIIYYLLLGKHISET